MFFFTKGDFPEFTDLKKANKKCIEADQAYANQLSTALSHPLEMWSRTVDPSLLPKIAEIYKCSQVMTKAINESVKNTDTAFSGLQDLVGLKKEFQPTKDSNEKIMKQAKDAASKVAKTERILTDLQNSNAPASQISRAESEHRAALDAERSANSIAESSQQDFITKYNDYQQRFVSALAASYCEASTARANTATILAGIGLQIQGLAQEMTLEPSESSIDSNLMVEMGRLKPLLPRNEGDEQVAN